jgi:hypothetical protein
MNEAVPRALVELEAIVQAWISNTAQHKKRRERRHAEPEAHQVRVGVSRRDFVQLAHTAVATAPTGHEQRADLHLVPRHSYMQRRYAQLLRLLEQRRKVVHFPRCDGYEE